MKNYFHNFCKTWVMTTAILLFIGISGTALANTTYRFQSVSSPKDPTFTQLLGINNDHVIAGYFGSGADPAHPNKGFTLTLPDVFVDENFPNSIQTQVVGINNRGETGGFYVDEAGTTHGFLSVDGNFQNTDAPNTAFNQILGVNDLGQAAGYSSTDPAGATGQQAFIRKTNGQFVYINFPAGTGNSQATGINDSRIMVGFYTDTAGNNHGFVYHNGHYQSVDDPDGIGTTIINGINDHGQIVGFYVNAAGNTVGFVGKPSHPRNDSDRFE